MPHSKKRRAAKIALRVVVSTMFILLGIGMKFGLEALRVPPKQNRLEELRLEVAVKEVEPEDVPVVVSGFGDVRSLDMVQVCAKVPGEVVEVHPRLEQGEVIPRGELLFRIDPRDYENAVRQAEAQLRQLESKVARLKTQWETDRDRYESVARSRDIAREEFERDKALFEENDIGTESMVNLAEVNYNKAEDALKQLNQALEMYPIGIREAESGLEAARAQLDMARTSLERTEVRAAFDARVKMAQVEVGQYVAPGPPILALADDSVLEISVPLDSQEARAWLPFAEAHSKTGEAWFGALEPVECRITWTEDTSGQVWHGTLDRVERYDQMSRTVSVAVRVPASQAAPEGSVGLPLVERMFCKVDIPGRVMENVYRMPRWAVTFEGEIYAVVRDEEGAPRLSRRDVEVVRTQNEETFVRGGVRPGDLVITTRLVNPLPDSLLDLLPPAGASPENAPTGVSAS